MAGSLPPSSRTVGVRGRAADRATCWAVAREPMNVRCEIEGWEVRWGAVVGQQVMGWIRCGECPVARRAFCPIEAK